MRVSWRIIGLAYVVFALAALAMCAPQSSATSRATRPSGHAGNASEPSVNPNFAAAHIRLNIGRTYLARGLWRKALDNCDAAAQLFSGPDSSSCIDEAILEGRRERHEWLWRQLRLVDTQIQNKNFDAADNTLGQVITRVAADAQSLGPLSNVDEDEFDRRRDAAVKGRAHAADRQWSSSVWNAVKTVCLYLVLYGLLLYLAYWVLRAIRAIFGLVWWRHFKKQDYLWRVWTISDKTDQRAAGAVMDALNHRLNPLFHGIETSSLLALPVGLDDEKLLSQAQIRTALRNFLVSTRRARPLVSLWLECLPKRFIERHRFRQIEAFEEDLTLTVGGFIQGNVNSFLRIPNRWFHKGLPAITGTVSTIDIASKKYALIRLVGNWDRQLRKPGAAAKEVPGVLGEDLFWKEETVSAYASTEIQPASDAVALSAQRAAFRFLYRVAIRYDEPSLAIAASSYVQGVRLLDHYLL
jgi:hypothetical protein